jgi:transmembrane sensor
MSINVDAAETSATQDRRQRARAEASVWIVRLHGAHRSPELEAGFRRWLAVNPDNAAEFERVTAVWESAPHASIAGLPRVVHRERSSPNPRRFAIASTLLLFVAAAVFFSYRLEQAPEYVTAIGEQRTIPLDDGSRIGLNSNSKIKIEFTADRRAVRLLHGEAFFEVAHNQERPFVVIAGDNQVTAVGTAFEVRYEPDHIDVTLVEGKVNVTSTAEPLGVPASVSSSKTGLRSLSSSGYAMTAGERLTIAKGAAPVIDAPRVDAVTAWRRGEVMLDDTPLTEAIAEMNRYNKNELIIDESSIATLHVSGIYHTGDSEGFAQTVAQLYGLQVAQEGGQIHLRSAAPPPTP